MEKFIAISYGVGDKPEMSVVSGDTTLTAFEKAHAIYGDESTYLLFNIKEAKNAVISLKRLIEGLPDES